MASVVTPLSVAMERASVNDVNELYERGVKAGSYTSLLTNHCQCSYIFGSYYIVFENYCYLAQFLLFDAGRRTYTYPNLQFSLYKVTLALA